MEQPVNIHRVEVFSAGPCDARVQQLFREVFSGYVISENSKIFKVVC
jgi:hypothetical protein